MEQLHYLTLYDLLRIARTHLDDPLIRDMGLLDAAVARPRASFMGVDAYPDLWLKAAALMESVEKNHALVDGNKRLAWLSTVTFLRINDVELPPGIDDAVVKLMLAVAVDDLPLEELRRRLRELAGLNP